MIGRRCFQLQSLLWGSHLSPESLCEHALARYDQDVEVNFYKSIRTVGLYEDEIEAVKYVMNQHPCKKALVIGCGAGREVIALKKLIPEVWGIDVSQKMIANAKLHASPGEHYLCADFMSWQSHERFDLIFVSGAIAQHIPGSVARQQFFDKVASQLRSGGGFCYNPDIRRLSLFSATGWAGILLRARWWCQFQWQQLWRSHKKSARRGFRGERGDSVRSFFGKHNQDSRLLYFHFYPGQQQFVRECGAGGGKVLRMPLGSWVSMSPTPRQ